MRARKAPDRSNAEQDTITSPPPKKKPKTKDTPVEDMEFELPAGSQDVEVLSTVPSTPAAGKRKKKKKLAALLPTLPESIILLVPTIHGVSQHVSIPYDSNFDDAAGAIYHLNSKSGKNLLTADDSWFSLHDAVVTRLNDKKKTTTDAIDICLSPDNYLVSLQLRKKPKLVKTLKNGKRSAKNVLDLDHLSEPDEDDVGGEVSMMEKEQEKLGELERKHQGKCQKCAADQPEVWCKIDKSGAHASITYIMRNSWAHSLMFMMGMMEQSKMNTALLANLTNSSSVRCYPSAGSPSRHSQPVAAAASAAATDTTNSDEDIADFFNHLDSTDSRCGIGRYLEVLIGDEVFNVGDIVRQGKEYLQLSVVGMKSTLASWVVEWAQKRVNSAR
ncbi:hypothetical protein B0H14DRAFT_2659408 [Mycena olivaceomarginata]|nr:hypothetical protein B0H14DRAFT_2659408 [Mycena olivaceomarginata]